MLVEKNIAVIDMGTNTFHLLVVQVGAKDYTVKYSEKRSVKLGENGISKGYISEAAISRALATIKDFCNKAISLGVAANNITAVATSAVRSAENKIDFCEQIKSFCGVEIEVITGESEAAIIYDGVAQSMDLGSNPSLIIDIGGGSVEFIICNRDNIYWLESYEIGGQRLMDQFHHSDPITNQSKIELEKFLDNALNSLWNACYQFNPVQLVGASGSFDTIANIIIKDKNLNIDLDTQTEYSISYHDFYTSFQTIISKDLNARRAIPGMIDLRAEMIVVACILIDTIAKKLNYNEIKISTYALKEGIVHRICKNISLND